MHVSYLNLQTQSWGITGLVYFFLLHNQIKQQSCRLFYTRVKNRFHRWQRMLLFLYCSFIRKGIGLPWKLMMQYIKESLRAWHVHLRTGPSKRKPIHSLMPICKMKLELIFTLAYTWKWFISKIMLWLITDPALSSIHLIKEMANNTHCMDVLKCLDAQMKFITMQWL